MPVHRDINLPSIQSPNNSTIILENSACSLFMFSDVSLRVILFPKNSKVVQMHDLKKKKNSLKYFILQKEAKKKKKG